MVNLAMAIAIPLYIYPTPGAWDPLYKAISAAPDTTFNVIVNPDSGPSDGASNPEVVSAVTGLRSYSNVQLFGYVHIEYAQRNATVVHQEIATYASWKKTANSDIHLDGIFIDEAPYELKYLPYLKDIQDYVHEVMPESHQQVWTNPGIPIDAQFYEYADLVNAYENSYDDWNAGGKDEIPECLRQKSTVMIYSFPDSDAQLSNYTESTIAAGYNATLLTTSAGYTEFSASLMQFVHDVDSLTKTTKVKTLPQCAEECEE
ncbi:hypothetical protein AUEXF2481DRAFT_27870 [Aureobasidium subglaciale EXF-2481]|uniref:Uncharacterized protein n=1 Tax=Aureobasidium subglaciale (strain EXF-2481) TaxID=1043005 RepID=A0A074ZDH7_AURSE|nr:uncharacterized protein AUEXF2481DRAFT_27870 [Aureobasidium subglaciale EXF-2481]KAI5209188.1 hypothetical protein E4T38_02522 [Aureobasidium subglaciale]KAI5228074.1 hypothetical protein E4T40_02301 [Aureobasidium subglaciale]KAI5231336.1 hypothetical protein E4T41_02521 [Aureobasidium subglaciale]KAI5265531.1 hypothetical protein E4T46_02299 [Aureobasidium subglaciale]KEQ96731.1 hypothetical protein AUEXF2481DRAFT_27870 [Aureobasidium subglaciale EXF-2481]